MTLILQLRIEIDPKGTLYYLYVDNYTHYKNESIDSMRGKFHPFGQFYLSIFERKKKHQKKRNIKSKM